jgi:hypothetical protein
MDTPERVTLVWLALVALTLGSAWLGEEGLPVVATALVVALIVAVKGLLVIRHYMGLEEEGSRLRRDAPLFCGGAGAHSGGRRHELAGSLSCASVPCPCQKG